ncbi:helix-turn-helix domain-containing protein [Geoalkalibacter sp.]|uniref:helix-turn-helix domain-containing protein n=1 Tax=Geoalkalibacter sp. TaxID=3041440 RepID=UPI00272DFF92|nr:helix-turn-helix transcriptional regulator [Geoalkalibacter sp.]
MKQRREARGLSLEDVAQTLRIRRPFLEALESESWDDLPGEAYFKGFLRSYAEYLGLDPRPMLESCRRHKPSTHSSSTPLLKVETELVEPSSSRKKSFFLLVLVLLAAAGVGVWLAGPDRIKPTSPMPTAESPAAPGAASNIAGSPDLEADLSVGEGEGLSETPADAAPREASGEASATPGPGAATSKPSADVLALIQEGGSSVRVRAHEATRLEILLDDRPAQTYQLQAGAALNWTARLRAHLVVENPAAISLWVDQQPVELVGRHSLSITAVASGREE